jgi:flagellar biosynthesis protein FlhA
MADVQRIFSNAFLRQRSDIFIALGVIVAVMMFIIPLPAFLLDTFMSLNLVFSLLVVLIVLYTKRSLDFSIFPTILLISAVFGLALNVSSTRLILAQGEDFNGRVVRAFSSFVVGSGGTVGIVIGAIIFVIIIVVQVVVITKGATRVAEVAARFTLDALPGKQMAIEAEYNSGAISEEESAQRKMDLEKEVDFYGAMDGAAKFVSGNVKAGIFITVLNVVGGIVVGVTLHGESFNTALNNYISLAIGDGLVSQFPALLVSVGTGLIVTRAVSDGTFGSDVTKQFSNQSKVYWIGAAFLLVLAFLPGFPWYILLPLGLLMGFLAYRLTGRQIIRETEAEEEAATRKGAEAPVEISPVAPLDPISVELGYGLVPLADTEQGGEIPARIPRIRREIALDLGLVVPRIRVVDNPRLDPSEYSLKIRGVEVGRGNIRLGHFLAINPGGVREEVSGEQTRDPAFGLPALWIIDNQRETAERAGYTVVDPPSIIATHLTEIIKRHAADILNRQEVKSILDTLKQDYPAVVDEVQRELTVGDIQKVLQGLLREQVSIRNMVIILETLADYGGVTKETGFLVEKTRQALARQISLQYADDDKKMRVITLDPELEQQIVDSRMDTPSGAVAALSPDVQRQWINSLTNTVRGVQEQGFLPIILCSEAARALVKQSAVREIPDLAVLSVPEIVNDIEVERIGEIHL